MTEPADATSAVDHRALAVGYFNAAWDLIDLPDRTPAQDREMVALASASRQHWTEAGGTAKNLAVSDWQVAHAASLAGFSDLALAFARAAVERTETAEDCPDWMLASAYEGLARAHAAAGDTAEYTRAAARAAELLAAVTEDEERDLIGSQLASIPPPG
jgi:hypothetical protein